MACEINVINKNGGLEYKELEVNTNTINDQMFSNHGRSHLTIRKNGGSAGNEMKNNAVH